VINKPFRVNFNHFFFVSDFGFVTGIAWLSLGEGGPEPATQTISIRGYVESSEDQNMRADYQKYTIRLDFLVVFLF
jgi:hypothetical protein